MLAFAIVVTRATAQDPTAAADESSYEFPKVVQGAIVEHSFVLRNESAVPLRIQGVRLTPPLMLARMPATIPAGGQVELKVTLNTSHVDGVFDGDIVVMLNDPRRPQVAFSLSGVIAPTVEVAPLPAFFVSAPRGSVGEGALDIVNHAGEPLRIDRVESASERFTLTLTTIEEGRRYRLALKMRPDGPGGKASEPVILHTSSVGQPQIRITANTYLRERVYTFPDTLDFGTIPAAVLNKAADQFAQTLMIYQQGGTQFEASFTTDAPLTVRSERGPAGDRWQASIVPRGNVPPGRITGTITIKTNDAEFPTLTVPVIGTILP